MDMSNIMQAVTFKLFSVDNEVAKVPQENIPYTNSVSSISLNCWYKAGLIHAIMLFMLNSDFTVWMLQQKSRLVRQQFFSSVLISGVIFVFLSAAGLLPLWPQVSTRHFSPRELLITYYFLFFESLSVTLVFWRTPKFPTIFAFCIMTIF